MSERDIVERLRSWIAPTGVVLDHEDYDLINGETPDEIERLREALNRIGLMATDTHLEPWARLNGIGEILVDAEARAALKHRSPQ